MTTSVVRAVVFDMDGLMLDTEPIYKVAWQTASAALGYELDDAFYASFVGRPNVECERDLLERFGSGFPLDRFRTGWPPLWRAEAATRGITKKAGLLELLAFLETQGVAVAVATSTEADDAAFTLGAAGLDGRFRVLVTGDEVARGKPAPDIYLEAARRLNVNPEECVALEDSEAGILAARRAGMVALLVPDGSPSIIAANAASRVLPTLVEARELIRDLLVERSR
jgi:beta-phosphoglucomutase-like phosphatase (HAD superfamily)